VSNWQNYENWQLAGALDATQRATGIWQAVLENYEKPPLDALDRGSTRRVRRPTQGNECQATSTGVKMSSFLMDKNKASVETVAVHAGEYIDSATRSSSPNLVMSATFSPTSVASFSALELEGYNGHVYGRVSSPTVQQLEEKLAALDGAEACRVFASGIAAAHALIMSRLSAGDHLVFPEVTYVGTAEFARNTLPRFGVHVTYVDTADLQAVEDAISPNTKMIWLETPANPTMKLTDVEPIAILAHSKGVRDVAVDATFCSPISMRPIELGCDFVVHSLTKYINGHGDAMGGAVLGRKDDLDKLSIEATVHYGGILSPFNAWLILRGAATLPIRMAAHEKSAMEVGRFLEGHPAVKRAFYPGLESHPQHELAKRQMKNFSGMMSFQTYESGDAIAARMIEKLKIVHYAVSLGHHRSLICWIPSEQILRSTYLLEGDALARWTEYAGDGIFRLSAGIESGTDICADLARVL
jgi:methionine-gamma-lyase